MAGIWKEITNIYTGLLSLQGHLVHGDGIPGAAIDPALTGIATEPRRNEAPRTFGVFESVLLLGGRPIHPDQPYDREEPFEQLVVAQDVRDAQPQARCA